jgi:hypothetical protein
MITTIIIADSLVNVMSSTSSRAAIVVTPELLLEHCAQLCQPLLLLLKLSLKLSELLQLGLWLPHRWWHGYACGVHGVGRGAFTLIFIVGSFVVLPISVGRGAFTLIFIVGSFVVLPIAHEAFSRQVVTLIVRVKTLMQVVVAAKELAPSP